MDPSTVKLLFLAVPMLGVVVVGVMMVVLYIRNVLDKVSDESTRYSRLRREEYQDQRLNVALRGWPRFSCSCCSPQYLSGFFRKGRTTKCTKDAPAFSRGEESRKDSLSKSVCLTPYSSVPTLPAIRFCGRCRYHFP